jgi:hypothetical protein
MLTVTEAAGAHLAQLLEQRNAPGDIAIRFVCEGQGIALRQDSERPGDTTFQHEGRTVLLLDAQVSELVAAQTLELEGTRLTLELPGDNERRQP